MSVEFPFWEALDYILLELVFFFSSLYLIWFFLICVRVSVCVKNSYTNALMCLLLITPRASGENMYICDWLRWPLVLAITHLTWSEFNKDFFFLFFTPDYTVIRPVNNQVSLRQKLRDYLSLININTRKKEVSYFMAYFFWSRSNYLSTVIIYRVGKWNIYKSHQFSTILWK